MTRLVYAALFAGLVFLLPTLSGGGSVESQDQSLEDRVAALETRVDQHLDLIGYALDQGVSPVTMPSGAAQYGYFRSLLQQAQIDAPYLVVPLTCEFREDTLLGTDSAGRSIVSMHCM
jgi:hypothetical protein